MFKNNINSDDDGEGAFKEQEDEIFDKIVAKTRIDKRQMAIRNQLDDFIEDKNHRLRLKLPWYKKIYYYKVPEQYIISQDS